MSQNREIFAIYAIVSIPPEMNVPHNFEILDPRREGPMISGLSVSRFWSIFQIIIEIIEILTPASAKHDFSQKCSDMSKSMFSGPYTIKKCISTCRAKVELDKCGYILNIFRIYARDDGYMSQLKNITESKQYYCYMKKWHERRVLIDACIKECKEPCEEVKYDVAETYFPEDFLEWEVSFSDFLVREIGQEPSYDVTALIANFGGTLGLMCGMSAVSVLELLIWSFLSISVLTYYSYKKLLR